MSPDLTVAARDGVAVLTLNRPDRLNAYTGEMGVLWGQAYRSCDEDDDVRAIVLTGAGEAFCAGADFSGGANPLTMKGLRLSNVPSTPRTRRPPLGASGLT